MACENCRKAKKRCDQGLPWCERCVRLGKTCGGYRDLSELMFKDESANINRRLSYVGPGPSRQRASSDGVDLAQTFFYTQFVTDSHLAFLKEAPYDDFLSAPVLACSFSVHANRRSKSNQEHELARRCYVDAVSATNRALRNPQRVKEDNTLLAIFLLGLYEQINADDYHPNKFWAHHVRGMTMLLQLRGRIQIRTKKGAAIFRELRTELVRESIAAILQVTYLSPSFYRRSLPKAQCQVLPCNGLKPLSATLTTSRQTPFSCWLSE